MTAARFAAALALAALSACTLLDGRPSIRLEVIGPAASATSLQIRVSGKTTADHAVLLIDGERLADVRVGQEETVFLLDAPVGYRSLQAVVFDGAYPARSNAVTVGVLRDPRYQVSPAPSLQLASSGPFHVEVALPWPPAVAGQPIPAFRLVDVATQEAVPLQAVASPDGTRYTLTILEPLTRYDQGLELFVVLKDEAGGTYRPAGDQVPRWAAPGVEVVMTAPADHVSTRGGTLPVSVRVSGSPAPASIAGSLGDRTFTLLPPTWSTVLDLAGLAEGPYQLRLQVDGFRLTPGPSVRTITIDRTNPTLSCSPALGPTADLADGRDIAVVFSEPVALQFCTVRIGGQEVVSRFTNQPGQGFTLGFARAGQPLPATVEVACLAADAAGNAGGSCSLPLPVWSQAMGRPILEDATIPLTFALAVADFDDLASVVWTRPHLGGVKTRAAPYAGRITPIIGSNDGLQLAASISSRRGTLAWIERPFGSRDVLWTADLDLAGGLTRNGWFLNRTAAGAARDPAVDPLLGSVAWVEDQPDGGQAIYEVNAPNVFFPEPVGGTPAVTSATSLSRPSLVLQTVAFLEGAPARLRVRQWQPGPGWVDLGGPLNADPQTDAASPALVTEALVAWAEGDQVLARQWDPAAGWSAPVAVAGAAGAPARLPVPAVARDGVPGVVFVERQGALDRIRHARLVAGTWEVQPEPVSGDYAGEVDWLTTSGRAATSRDVLTVTWAAPFGGQVYAAGLNE